MGYASQDDIISVGMHLFGLWFTRALRNVIVGLNSPFSQISSWIELPPALNIIFDLIFVPRLFHF
jgi:hypothetical protein